MGDISKNISRHEVACKCGCGYDTIDAETVSVVQDCCDHFADSLGVERVTLVINSGCRCDSHNNKVGGSKNSTHKKARAMDIKITPIQPEKVYEYLDKKYPGKYGIGKYETFTHIDTRSGAAARW